MLHCFSIKMALTDLSFNRFVAAVKDPLAVILIPRYLYE